jgi:hypothetical protein
MTQQKPPFSSSTPLQVLTFIGFLMLIAAVFYLVGPTAPLPVACLDNEVPLLAKNGYVCVLVRVP